MTENRAQFPLTPIEYLASPYANDTIRELAMRITHLREETRMCTTNAVAKLVYGVPISLGIAGLSGISAGLLLRTAGESETLMIVLSGITLLGATVAGVFAGSGAQDLNQAALSRGEINSLTTVLASHIIAESTQEVPQ